MNNIKLYADFQIKKADNNLYIQGYASVESVDRDSDIILSASAYPAIKKAMDDYMKNPLLLYMHNWEKAIGKVVEYQIDDKGIFIKAMLSNAKGCEDYKKQIEEGVLKAFSIGFRAIDGDYDKASDVFVIKSLEMYEISVVTIPANKECLFEVVAKSLNKIKSNKKEIQKMDLQNKYNELYMENADLKAEHKVTVKELQTLKDMIEKNATKSAEEKADIEQTIKNWETQLEEYKTKMAEQEKQLKEWEEKGLKFEKGANPTKDNEVEKKAFDNVKFDLSQMTFNELEAHYISKNALGDDNTRGKDKFTYSKADVVKSFMAEKGLNFDENNASHKELVTKAITSSTGIMRVTEVDYRPIEMSDLRTPLAMMTPRVKQNSKTYTWYQRTAKNTAQFASEGFTPTLTNSTYGAKTQNLLSQYAGSQVNDFAENLAGISMVQLETEACNQSMDENLQWTLLHGNATADSTAFNGLFSYLSNDSAQVIDKNETVLSLDLIEDMIEAFKGLMDKKTTAERRPNAFLVDRKAYSKIRKLLLAKYSGIAMTGTINIDGIVYNTVMYDGIPFVEMDDLRNYSGTAATVSASALAGGSLDDDTYYCKIERVDASGIVTASSEVNATTSGTDNSVRLAVTAQAGDLYYRVFWGETTGNDNLKLIKTVKATEDAGDTQNIDITAEPTQGNELPLEDANNCIVMAVRIGGRDGLEIGYNEEKTFVRLAKTGDHERFYIRSYICGKLKNEYAVVKGIYDLA